MVAEIAGALLGNVHEDLRCRLSITGIDDAAIKVASFEANEGLSRLSRYAIVVATSPDDVDALEAALGRDATFAVERNETVERIVHGIVAEVVPDGAYVGKTQTRTTLILAPRLANLQYAGGFRMFQAMSVKDIVAALFAPERIEAVWRVRPEPPVRDYRTQLDESDFAFMARLVSDEGLHFFFEYAEDKTTVVFTNDPKGFLPLDGGASFEFRDSDGVVAGEHVRAIQRAQRIRTGAVEHRDYDFRNPRMTLKSRAETANDGESNTTRREWRDYPGEFVDPDAEGSPRALMRLNELRSDAYELHGLASSMRFAAGRQFTLTGHRDGAFNRKLLLLRTILSANVGGALFESASGGRSSRASASLTRFDAVPAEVPLRPARIAKPASRLQTARVVGPTEGDPYVDEFGRIKVQFAWDRDGQFDEHSSCWIRMATPVAHGDEGFFSAHRVGSEVLVDFIDGDIDRPIVTGAIYNGREKQPYKQPDRVTRSSWKVRSIPGGKGFNEITFENQAGEEQILTHAQRDKNTHVLRNHSETVGANQTSSIGADQTVSVGADQTISIGAKRTLTVGNAEEATIAQGRSHTVRDTDDDLYVTDGDRNVNVYKGNHTREVKLLDKTEADNIEIHARYDVHATGDRIVQLKQGDTTATFQDGNLEVEAAGHVQVHHKGTTILIDAAGKITITADPELEIDCKGAQISMAGGKITMNAPQGIELAVGQSGVKITSDSVAIAAPSVKSTALTGANEISGMVVKLN